MSLDVSVFVLFFAFAYRTISPQKGYDSLSIQGGIILLKFIQIPLVVCNSPGDQIGSTKSNKAPRCQGMIAGYRKASPFHDFSQIVWTGHKSKESTVRNHIMTVAIADTLFGSRRRSRFRCGAQIPQDIIRLPVDGNARHKNKDANDKLRALGDIIVLRKDIKLTQTLCLHVSIDIGVEICCQTNLQG